MARRLIACLLLAVASLTLFAASLIAVPSAQERSAREADARMPIVTAACS